MKNLIIRITSTRAFLVFSMILYRFLLDLAFVNIISKSYGYMGFMLDINNFKIIESYIIIFLFCFFLKHKINKPSDFFILFLFSMIIVPLSSIYSLQDKAREFFYYMILSFLVIIVSSKGKSLKIIHIKNGDKFVIVSTFLVGVTLFTWIILKGGLRYLNFNLFKVYDFRRTVAKLIFPGYLSYLMTWFGNTMNPFFIALNLWKKNKRGLIFTLAIQVLYFGVTAHKSMLFYPIIIIFIYKASQNTNFAQMIPFGLSLVNLLAIVQFYVSKSLALITLFSRRVHLVTAKLHYVYYEFFKERGFVYYSNRKWFPKIIEYPYTLPIQQVVNQGRSEGWANTGFLANGYAHFGFFGMIVYSIIVGIIFNYVNSISEKHLPMWLCISITIPSIFSLTSGDLPTVLLNHGLFISMVILWLMSSRYTENKLSNMSINEIDKNK